jgi:Na+-translocating ferredoxin:NAD+ oxidoreductase RnfC subunit
MNTPAAFDARAVQSLADCARAHGVVGAGGGGFSLADKLLARPYQTLIINAAQSEPLICKDWAALAQYGECVLDGAKLLIEAFGLKKAFLAVREEFALQLPVIQAAARKAGVVVSRLPDIYPIGYEKVLTREVLGLAPDNAAAQSVLVVNAETLRNVAWAVLRQRPVTNKLITVAGAVAKPISLSVPVGTPFAECLALAGGATLGQFAVFHNGVLAGEPIDPAQSWVSATTLGYVVLPATHSAVIGAQSGDVMSVRLAERRSAFSANALAGRTQAMSAAYALYDLTAYRRARHLFQGVPASDLRSDVLNIVPVGRARSFQPSVAAGEQVRRGQVIAIQSEGQITRHASVDSVVERATADCVALRCVKPDGSM